MTKEKRKYEKDALEKINQRKRHVAEDGLIILEKPVPDTDEAGVIDPDYFKILKGNFGDFQPPDTFIDALKEGVEQLGEFGKVFTGDLHPLTDPVKAMFDGERGLQITEGVKVEEALADQADHPVRMLVYTPEGADGPLPVLIYYHGGGFVGGELRGVDAMCKYLSKKAGLLVFSVEYRLAPDNKYPDGFDDCYNAFLWVREHAKARGGDPGKIAVAGDSAGGNLAAAVVLKAEDAFQDPRIIKAQVLIYPVLDVRRLPDVNANFDMKKLSPKKDYQPYVAQSLMIMELLIRAIPIAIGTKAERDPYMNPARNKDVPEIPTLLIVPEYDVLRPEAEKYAKKLLESGSPVRMIRYKGMMHGFIDLVGILPQSEDALNEIADFLRLALDQD